MEKVKVHQIQPLFIALNRIYEINDVLPSVFDLHMGRLLPELNKLNERIAGVPNEKYQEIKDEEIELPITKIHPSDLPENIPNDIEARQGKQRLKLRTINLLKPILIQEEPQEFDSGIDSLLEEGPEGNGQKEVEEKEANEEAA